MSDIFDAAFAEGEDPFLDHVVAAPSQGCTSACQGSNAPSPYPATLVVSDTDEGDYSRLSPTPVERCTATEDGVKRLSPQTGAPATKRQRKVLDHVPKLTPVSEANGTDVACIFVPHSKKVGDSVAVPLWPQYLVTWKKQDFSASRWIKFGNYDSWFMQLINVLTHASVRERAKVCRDAFQHEFKTALEKVRRLDSIDYVLSGVDVDNEVVVMRRSDSWPGNHKCRRVNIGGFEVTCLNCIRPCVLKVDDDTIKLILGWLVPVMMRMLARSQAIQDAPSPAPPSRPPFASVRQPRRICEARLRGTL